MKNTIHSVRIFEYFNGTKDNSSSNLCTVSRFRDQSAFVMYECFVFWLATVCVENISNEEKDNE